MLLAVDIGNTQTHVGAFESDRLVWHWRFQTRAGAAPDELAVTVRGLLALRDIAPDAVDGIIVSSVVPPLGESYATMTERHFEASFLAIGPGVKTGMPIRIENPQEVGADRLVNAVAAFERVGGACVVVDFGTGINIDAVSSAGEYLGGAIAPGVEVSLSALVERGARLPRIDLAEPDAAIGRSTRGAIQSGVIFGFAGLVDSVTERIIEELDGDPHVLATGGFAHVIAPHCDTVDEIDDLLTLEGLRLVWEKNR